MTKALNLPEPVAAYFAADRLDGDAVARCFNKDAIVTDEGQTYSGIEAIRNWKIDTSRKYNYTSDPIACAEENGETIVTSHLVGNFPGSPVDLRYFFRLERGKIARLEVKP
jgi:hypothetical protein